MSTLAVFGGSFDPPHVAHVLLAAFAKIAAPVDEVLVVPTYKHPFGKRSASFADRVAMCELAFADQRSVNVSTLESRIEGDSRTYYTLTRLQAERPGARLRLIIGADILGDVERWFRWDDVARIAPPLVVGRPGYPTPDAATVTLPDVSSTEIRGRLARGEAIDGLVPPAVAAYAMGRNLYGPEP